MDIKGPPWAIYPTLTFDSRAEMVAFAKRLDEEDAVAQEIKDSAVRLLLRDYDHDFARGRYTLKDRLA